MNIYQKLITSTVGTAVAVSILFSYGCSSNDATPTYANPTNVPITLRGRVVSEEVTPIFYHITYAAAWDGRERTFSIDRNVWKTADDLEKRITEGTCIEVKGVNRDVVSVQMYVGPDIVDVVDCK